MMSTAAVVEDHQSDEDSGKKPKRAYELDLNPEYWRKKFLYPFALDPAPLRLDASSK